MDRQCPVCKGNEKKSALELRQINFNTAVYICNDLNCTYPRGHSWIYVARNILEDQNTDIDSSDDEKIQMKTSKTSNKNCITNEICDKKIETNQTLTDLSQIDFNSVNIIDNVVIDDPDDILQSIKNNKNSLASCKTKASFVLETKENNTKFEIKFEQKTNDNPQLPKQKMKIIPQNTTEPVMKLIPIKPNLTIKKMFKNKNVKLKPAPKKLIEDNLDVLMQGKSRFRLKIDKEKTTFADSVFEDALTTANELTTDSKESTSKNRSFLNIIPGSNNKLSNRCKNASKFDGFRFNTKVVKPAKIETSKINVSANLRKAVDKNLDEETLEEFLDNIDTINVPQSSDLVEVEDWLSSLCQ